MYNKRAIGIVSLILFFTINWILAVVPMVPFILLLAAALIAEMIWEKQKSGKP